MKKIICSDCGGSRVNKPRKCRECGGVFEPTPPPSKKNLSDYEDFKKESPCL